MNKSCSRCGAAFDCWANAADRECWCSELPAITPNPAADCFCPNCLKAITQTAESSDSSMSSEQERPLVEGEDYYLEGQSVVFTALYHLRRGYCCESGCRHCPFV